MRCVQEEPGADSDRSNRRMSVRVVESISVRDYGRPVCMGGSDVGAGYMSRISTYTSTKRARPTAACLRVGLVVCVCVCVWVTVCVFSV